jgi:hypothetical protein
MHGNLADLAATGLASEPTLRRWIAAQPDQPWILKRGSNGDAYEIDIPGAVEAFRAAEEAKSEEARNRADSIRQLALELGITGPAGEDAVALSIAERRQLLEEELVAIKLSKMRRELVAFAEVQAAVGDVLVKFRQRLRSFSARVAKRVDLTREQIAAIDRLLESDLTDLADDMEKMEKGFGDGREGAGEDGDEGAAAELEDTAVPNGL